VEHGSKVFTSNFNTVSVIDTATNTVIATIPAGGFVLTGVAVTPDGSKVYVANSGGGNGNTVSVIDTATNMVTTTIPVGSDPIGVAVTPDGSTVYVANSGGGNGNTVSVIDTATNIVTTTIPVGRAPFALGVFIQPPPRFAGTPGNANCYGPETSSLYLCGAHPRYGSKRMVAGALTTGSSGWSICGCHRTIQADP
jgi:YVTN family beta-propeller protein